MIARLKSIRQKAEPYISASKVARAVGVTQQSVFKWESGKAQPRRRHMDAVRDYLLAQGAIPEAITAGMLFDFEEPSEDTQTYPLPGLEPPERIAATAG